MKADGTEERQPGETYEVLSSGRRMLLAGLAILLAILGPLFHSTGNGLGYDEGDYYRAVSRGFWLNWTDSDDISPASFISTGLKAIRGEVDKGELSRAVRASGSTAFYRHFHPPVSFYPSIAVRGVAPDLSPESTLRISSVIFMVGWTLILLLIATKRPEVFPESIALLPATAHYIQSASAFNMHIPFGLAAVTMFLTWRAFHLRGGDDTFLRRSTLILFAISLCIVEYSLVLLGGVVMWTLYRLFCDRATIRQAMRRRAVDLLWVLGTMLVIWPGGILNLGLMKSYAQQTYIALFRLKDVPSGFDSTFNLIGGKFSPSPFDLLLLVAGLAAGVAGLRYVARRGYHGVALLLALAILVLQLSPSLVLPWYTFPLFSIALLLFLTESLLLLRVRSRTKDALRVGLPVVTFAMALGTVNLAGDDSIIKLKEAVETSIDRSRTIVADQSIAPSLGGYFLDRNIVGYHTTEIPLEQRADSLRSWRASGAALILPVAFGNPGNDTVAGFVLEYVTATPTNQPSP